MCREINWDTQHVCQEKCHQVWEFIVTVLGLFEIECCLYLISIKFLNFILNLTAKIVSALHPYKKKKLVPEKKREFAISTADWNKS